MSELGKPFLKNSDKKQKKIENQCQNAASEQKATSENCKFDSNKKTSPRMNYEWIEKFI